MDAALTNTRLELAKEGLIAVRDAQDARIECLAGTIWVTQEGALKDDVLEAGDSLVVRKPGLTVITALVPAALTVSAPVGRENQPSALKQRREWSWLGLHPHGNGIR